MTRKSWLKFWLTLAVSQLIGAYIPTLTNIHSNIWPMFAALFLLPGILLPFCPYFSGWAYGAVLFVVIPLNAVFWFAVARILATGKSPDDDRS